MADIDIVPKQSSHTWVWIVLALMIAVLAFWFLSHSPTRAARADGAGAVNELSQPVPLRVASALPA